MAFLKDTIEDPLSPLLEFKNDIDASIGTFITLLVKTFLNKHKDIIDKAIRTDIEINTELHFSITLKEDNSDNRDIIFEWLRDYKATNIWEIYPVYFQIAPGNIITLIKSKEVIIGEA